MHRETKATAISAATKKAVWERDFGRCVLCGHINPIGGFFASGLVFKIPVNRDGETDHRDTGLRVTQFDVLSNAALDHNPI